VLGYCLFPLTIAALVNRIFHNPFVRLPVIVVTYAWSALGIILIAISDADNSLGVSVTWKSTRGQEMVGHLSHVIVLLCLGLYYPHFELTEYINWHVLPSTLELCEDACPLACLGFSDSERSSDAALHHLFWSPFTSFIRRLINGERIG